MKFTCKYVNTFFPKDTKHVRHNYYLVWIPSSKILVNEVETVSINLKSAIDNILCFHRQTFNTQNVIPCSISITFLSQWRYWNILLLLKFMSEMLWEHFPPRNAFRLDTSDFSILLANLFVNENLSRVLWKTAVLKIFRIFQNFLNNCYQVHFFMVICI